jgi:hypothetical protein
LAGAAPPPTAKGKIASPQIFLGCSVQSKGIVMKVEKDLGALVQNGNFNSKRILLILVKSLENLKKTEKCKLNFLRLLVKSTTTFVKLVYVVS